MVLENLNGKNIVHLQNVYVGNHGTIFDESGKMMGIDNDFSKGYGANSHIYSYQCYIISGEFIVKNEEDYTREQILKKNFIEVPDRNYIHAFPYFNVFVWGHLHDTLNNLEDFDNTECADMKFKLAVSSITAHVTDLFLHFELLGYKKEDVFSFPIFNLPPFKNGKIYKFKNLYVSTVSTGPAFIRNKDWIEKKYIYENPYIKESADELKNKKYKLYLSRNQYHGSASGYKDDRKTVNEPEIWSVLKDKGYIKLDGAEKLIDNIKYFAGAEKIICTHSSMIRNMMFCLNKDVEIWEFYPLAKLKGRHKYAPEDVFQRMSRSMGMQHYYYLPIESGDDWSVRLDLELIKRIS